ncbi:cytochrome P450 [Fomitopsis serialis]|uniref:cytochrome P450 n=1 Tax=Fomitopsis serialis TaxID=139415 RepID=UPI0020078283|nr:cytochrome P450 [Neoantrodia serialis]KAH9929175.1 cytochrome P450 [Neoantrodia serialis]
MGLLFSVLRVVALLGTAYVLFNVLKNYFGRSPLDNIPGPPSGHWLNGNLGQLFNRAGWDFNYEIGLNYGPVLKLYGSLGTRQLFVFDPAALSSIIVKDQYIYEEAPEFLASMHCMLGDGLLATLGERHRKQRRLLNPVFSIAHMRHMLPIFYSITSKLQEAITVRVKAGQDEIDILDWMGRTALELVGQAGLGWSFDPLVKDTVDHNLGTAVKAIVPTTFPLRLFRPLLPLATKIGSPAFQRKMIDLIPSAKLRRAKQISDEIQNHSRIIFEEKKRAMREGDEAVTHQIGEGKDIMSKLMQANMSASEEDKLPEDELLGQMATFIFAGMDTTSNALARTLDLLSKHPDVQNKLREEVLEAVREHGPEIPYDVLVELPYMDAICRETLRLYAPVPYLIRKTREDIVMPLSAPIRGVDGTLINEVPVPEGTVVHIGILASNRNPALWGPDAAEWKPERWLNPLPEVVKEAHIPGVYSHLMTFLGGGRACIGFKFSQLEMKIVLSVLLANFTFAPSGKEIFWNVAGIQYPTVGMSPVPEMPMKVGLVKA